MVDITNAETDCKISEYQVGDMAKCIQDIEGIVAAG